MFRMWAPDCLDDQSEREEDFLRRGHVRTPFDDLSSGNRVPDSETRKASRKDEASDDDFPGEDTERYDRQVKNRKKEVNGIMARYRKIDPRIWNDEKFRELTDDGRLVFLFILTHPHLTNLGAMRANIPGLAYEIGWDVERLSKAF